MAVVVKIGLGKNGEIVKRTILPGRYGDGSRALAFIRAELAKYASHGHDEEHGYWWGRDEAGEIHRFVINENVPGPQTIADPTLNDFLDLIRPELEKSVERFRRSVRAIENREAARGISGNLISAVLDAAKEALETAVIGTFREVRRISATARLDRNELRNLTVQALTNFLEAIKAITAPERLKQLAAGSHGVAQLIDKHIRDLDGSLALMIRQMDTGLLNLGDELQLADRTPATGSQPFVVSAYGSGGYGAGPYGGPHAPKPTKEDGSAVPVSPDPTAGTAPHPVLSSGIGQDVSLDMQVIRAGPSADGSPPAGVGTRASIVAAARQNRETIDLATAAFSLLVDEKLRSLRETRPNSLEARADLERAILYYEGLKQTVDALREAASRPLAAESEKDAVVQSTTTFADTLRNWWTQRHVEFFDMGLFLGGVGICAALGASGLLVAGICGVIVGGNRVAEVIKAIARGKDNDNH